MNERRLKSFISLQPPSNSELLNTKQISNIRKKWNQPRSKNNISCSNQDQGMERSALTRPCPSYPFRLWIRPWRSTWRRSVLLWLTQNSRGRRSSARSWRRIRQFKNFKTTWSKGVRIRRAGWRTGKSWKKKNNRFRQIDLVNILAMTLLRSFLIRIFSRALKFQPIVIESMFQSYCIFEHELGSH